MTRELRSGGRVPEEDTPVENDDEFDRFAQAYHAMRRNLENANRKLLALNTELEDRVAGRTRELEATNQKLVKDIAMRRIMENELRDSEEKYRLLVENANDAIFVLQDGRFKFFNRRFAEMARKIGYTPEADFEP
jgi:PAS domain-containing protein